MDDHAAVPTNAAGRSIQEVSEAQMTEYQKAPGMTPEEACTLARRENIIHAALEAESLADLKQVVQALALELISLQG